MATIHSDYQGPADWDSYFPTPCYCRECGVDVRLGRNLTCGLCDTCWRALHPTFEPRDWRTLTVIQRQDVLSKAMELRDSLGWGACDGPKRCLRHARLNRAYQRLCAILTGETVQESWRSSSALMRRHAVTQ